MSRGGNDIQEVRGPKRVCITLFLRFFGNDFLPIHRFLRILLNGWLWQDDSESGEDSELALDFDLPTELLNDGTGDVETETGTLLVDVPWIVQLPEDLEEVINKRCLNAYPSIEELELQASSFSLRRLLSNLRLLGIAEIIHLLQLLLFFFFVVNLRNGKFDRTSQSELN